MRETTSRREEECKEGVSSSGWGQQHRKHCQHTYDGSLEHQEGVFFFFFFFLGTQVLISWLVRFE